MVVVVFGLMLALQVKHFVADYLLQSGWIIEGKGSFTAPGGYAHAGIHAGFSLVILLVFGVPAPWALGVALAEFVIHYLLDYAKAHYSHGVRADAQPKLFWAQHGLDQMFHHLTYTAMVFVALWSKGLI